MPDLLNLLLEVQYFLRNFDIRKVHPRAGFVHDINSLVRQIPVGYISVAEPDRSIDCFIGIFYAVMLLVFLFDIHENLDGFINRRWVNHDLLKTPVEGSIFLYVLSILIERGCPNALQVAPGQCRFEHV